MPTAAPDHDSYSTIQSVEVSKRLPITIEHLTYEMVGKLDSWSVGRRILEVNND